MGTPGRILQNGAVVVTAIMTLIAGSPHFDCLCPSGRFKSFCFAFFFSPSGSCCSHEGCCPELQPDRDSQAPPEGSCCCCHAKAHPSSDTTSQTNAQLGQTGCQKTLLGAKAATLSLGGQAAAVKLFLNLLVAVLPYALPNPVIPTHDVGRGEGINGLPPPTDLVTVLQQLLI
jgi:hypothetical protein